MGKYVNIKILNKDCKGIYLLGSLTIINTIWGFYLCF